MKKLRILASALILSGLVSCNDAIDIRQDGELLENVAFQTIADLESGVSGAMRQFSHENAIAFTSVFTDEIKIGFATGGQGINGGEYTFILDPSSGDASSIWLSNYRMINFANRVLRAAANIEYNADDPTQVAAYNNVLGQCRALRAYAHLQLLSYFSPNMADNSALGVIRMDFVPLDVTINLPRNTNGEVYELIEADLAFAEENITSVASATRTFLSKSFVYATKARMYAYRQLYPQAEAAVEQVVATGQFNLTPVAGNAYINIWRDAPIVPPTNNEVIFKLERTGTGDPRIGGIWFSVDHTISGSPFYEMSNALHNLLNPLNLLPNDPAITDIRIRAFLGLGSVLNNPQTPEKILLINKYPGSEGLPRLNDVKIFRRSEMEFIRAEARVAAGDLTGAATIIRTVRAARNSTPANVPTPTYASAQEAWADILLERRIELCFEGHRYVDLRRMGARAGQTIDRADIDCQQYNACSLPITDYRFTLPIPLDELNGNSAIQQNPNY